MTIGRNRSVGAALLIGTMILASQDVGAATKAAGPPAASSPIQILPGTSSKEPVSIDADKLVYFDKEKKAIYSGNVVVVQGDTKMTCSVMTVFLERSPTPGGASSRRTAKHLLIRLGPHAARGDRTRDGDFQDPGRDRRQRGL